jgi:hypothetical protein
MADLETVNEGSSALYEATLKDEKGAVIDGTALDSLFLTVYDVSSGTVLRGPVDAKNANGVTVTALGVLTWTLLPADNAVVGQRAVERHAAMFEAAWSTTKRMKHELTWLVRNLKKAT